MCLYALVWSCHVCARAGRGLFFVLSSRARLCDVTLPVDDVTVAASDLRCAQKLAACPGVSRASIVSPCAAPTAVLRSERRKRYLTPLELWMWSSKTLPAGMLLAVLDDVTRAGGMCPTSPQRVGVGIWPVVCGQCVRPSDNTDQVPRLSGRNAFPARGCSKMC